MELTNEQFKKVKSIEKRLKALNSEIRKMGFNVYLASGSINIMCGPSHDDSRSAKALNENSVHSFYLDGWDGGDW